MEAKAAVVVAMAVAGIQRLAVAVMVEVALVCMGFHIPNTFGRTSGLWTPQLLLWLLER